MSAIDILERWDALPLDDAVYACLHRLERQVDLSASPTDAAAAPSAATPHAASTEIASMATKEDTNSGEQASAHAAFLHWYEQLEESMEKQKEAPFLQHQAAIGTLQAETTTMLSTIAEALGVLDALKEEHLFVEQRSTDLQAHCEALLREQRALTLSSSSLLTHLKPFSDLETVTRSLQSVEEHHFNQAETITAHFIPALERLDGILHFMLLNKSYKDAGLYLTKAKATLQHALTLIRNHFSNVLRRLHADVQRILNDKGTLDLQPSTQSTIFYVKFRNEAPKMRVLLAELESRCPHHHEMMHLLTECHQGFLLTRSTLLHPLLLHQIKKLQTDLVKETHSDLIQFGERAVDLIDKVITDEETLFKNFFSTGFEALEEYLENTATLVYDTMRPFILRETDLTVLSKWIKGLKRMPQLQGVMEDASSKLCFRVQAYIDTELRPLAPPTAAQLPAETTALLAKEDFTALPKWADVNTEQLDAEAFRSWYPALYKALHVIDVLWEAIDDVVFVDIVKDMIPLCVQALTLAASQIATTKTRAASGRFLLQHLLLLKKRIDQLALDEKTLYIMVDLVDFKDSLMSIFSAQGGFLNTIAAPLHLWRGLSTVNTLAEDKRNTMLDIDTALKRLCEEIATTTDATKDAHFVKAEDGSVSVDAVLDHLERIQHTTT